MPKFTVESVTETRADWGVSYVAYVRRRNDVTLYTFGPEHSVADLLQAVLNRFGKE